MEMTKVFINQFVIFEIFEINETEVAGIYETHAGTSKNGKEVDLSVEGFNNLLGGSKILTKNFKEYGYKSIDGLKKGVISAIYCIALHNAEEVIAQHILSSLRNNCSLININPKSYLSEGPATDNSNRWSIFMNINEIH